MYASFPQESFDRAMVANVSREAGKPFRSAIGRCDMLIVERASGVFVDVLGSEGDVTQIESAVQATRKATPAPKPASKTPKSLPFSDDEKRAIRAREQAAIESERTLRAGKRTESLAAPGSLNAKKVDAIAAGKPLCSIDGCAAGAKWKGLCFKHEKQLRLAKIASGEWTACRVESCEYVAKTDGMCAKHARAAAR